MSYEIHILHLHLSVAIGAEWAAVEAEWASTQCHSRCYALPSPTCDKAFITSRVHAVL